MMRARTLLWCALVIGCGSPPPAAYVSENERAEAAQSQGDPLGAARHYERAAELASQPRDESEARFRAAEAYARAGDWARAEALYRALARAQTGADRAERADFALGALLSKAGRDAEAQAQLEHAIRLHPSSGLAPAALSARLDYIQRESGSDGVLAYLRERSAQLSRSELAETLAYRLARALDAADKTQAARDAYLSCATRFPYPRGAYWDDALFRAAQAELRLGEPERAIADLRRMLAEQERAAIVGSYERGRYAEAQLTLGAIYRDVLHDPDAARRELRRVWERHPQSRLVDDALFQEALVARSQGDAAGACSPLRILTERVPGSRYAACAPLLCPSLPGDPRACHDYIKRDANLTEPPQ